MGGFERCRLRGIATPSCPARREYLAVVDAATLPEIPVGLVRRGLPLLKYLRFAHGGTAREPDLLLDYIDHIWLLKNAYRPAQPY